MYFLSPTERKAKNRCAQCLENAKPKNQNPKKLIREIVVLITFISGIQFNLDAQITYPDSCLHIDFYFRNQSNELDTLKTINLKPSEFRKYFSSMNDSSLGLVLRFRNSCAQRIRIPAEIRLDNTGQDEFWIQGVRIGSDKIDTLDFNIEYDYFDNSRSRDNLEPNSDKLIPYKFPLGFEIKEKGLYKFRLFFYNWDYYKKVEDWITYTSNWITLVIK